MSGFSKEALLSAYKQAPKPEASWVGKLQEQALDEFSKSGFPTSKSESWRYTNLKPLLEQPFSLPGVGAALQPSQLSPFTTEGVSNLVFVEGGFSEAHSSKTPEGVEVVPVSKATKEEQALLAQKADQSDKAFVALNNAFLDNGVIVRIKSGESNLQLLHLGPADKHWLNSRVLIVVEPNAKATLLERFVGEGEYVRNTVVQVHVKDSGRATLYRLQSEADPAFHVGTLQVHQERDSVFKLFGISTGARLARHEVDLEFLGEGADGTLSGVYLARGTQHVDTQTRISHSVALCKSHEFYKGILDNKARGVFCGMVYVAKDAQKTDAEQSNKNLLLSDEAEVDTKPQLEIYADDVKCAHGATVGQLDESALYYLKTRGVDEPQARAILVQAFAKEMTEKVEEPFRKSMEQAVLSWLEGV